MTTDLVRRLVLVRHSKASHDADSDLERPLTPKGVTLAEQLARQLRQRLDHTDLLLVSPAARARQTAQPLRQRLDPAEVQVHEEIYSHGVSGVLDLVAAGARSARSVVVVGHEPTVSALAHTLHDTDDDLGTQVSFGVPTATAVLIDVASRWEDLAPGGGHISEILTARRH
ncbi:phosphohistidine phosphatase SixA [Actinomyces lilanjuaniae]|uniref:Phosphohistidine phosphatase SixA n=1 Tax=Actinomyces lilanjuaniae TaxID=2321394 RepID=A0ABM6Z3W8_9ACTO|nr:phosphohistidine phosphatase SixA [Actinomyces lilanjuaniae]AYD89909.1 phosphohistidine phosphatase SixA [Actinomyces lilanjuaniae]